MFLALLIVGVPIVLLLIGPQLAIYGGVKALQLHAESKQAKAEAEAAQAQG
ncbi:hypothetical protein [Aureimonas psammosilenae]|uniref:hypothetical protein n=1 Tax=Aureimonas psammosilenae TaxID=2495496 RepID=UPI00186A9DE8|nr:hypothetical protein [Aureimonas psammosilenae]